MSVIVENKELNCYGAGETQAEAEADLQEHIKYYSDFYCNTNDRNLTQHGQELKRKFENLQDKVK